MTQYCRYCGHCFVGNGNWCEALEKELTDSQIKRVNKCRTFAFNPMDVYDPDREYKPRKRYGKRQRPEFDVNIPEVEQMRLEDV